MRYLKIFIMTKHSPALAVDDGRAGAIRASANVRPYASPKELCPKAVTNMLAIRSPNPLVSKLLAKKKAMTISQIESLNTPEKAT